MKNKPKYKVRMVRNFLNKRKMWGIRKRYTFFWGLLSIWDWVTIESRGIYREPLEFESKFEAEQWIYNKTQIE